jgi:Amt family ammonium transporter
MPKSFGKSRQFQFFRFLSRWRVSILLATVIVFVSMNAAIAQSSEEIVVLKRNLQVGLDTLWVIFTGCLVFFMNAGFAMLETGFCRPKNAVSILAKNLIVFAIATVAFWFLGFGLMFGDGNWFCGLQGFFLQGADNSPATDTAYQGIFTALNWTGVPLEAKFFFQLVFAGTAATIVSGAVAERIKFFAFFLFSVLLVGISYPISGHWVWGGGWLQKIGFWDFAGSTVVHSVGGCAALVGAILLGPRFGKYQGGKSFGIPGHNLSLATLGCLILWLGWFGFNPGSVMALQPQVISHVLLTTNMAAATGGIAATLMAWRYFGKPDLSVIMNGILAGLVGITASCRFVSLGSSALIGIIAGILVVLAIDYFDKLQIDDPVGAVSVHLVSGIWGTLAVALFAIGPNVNLHDNFILYQEGPVQGLFVGGGIWGLKQVFIQLLGSTSVCLFTLLTSWLSWSLIRMTISLRVPLDEEIKGLDISQHGLSAYSGFLLRPESQLGSKNPHSS